MYLYVTQRMADVFFGGFAISWVIFRLIIFPFYVIRMSLFESITIVPFFRSYYLFNGMLLTLQILNIYWFWLIANIVYQKVVNDIEVCSIYVVSLLRVVFIPFSAANSAYPYHVNTWFLPNVYRSMTHAKMTEWKEAKLPLKSSNKSSVP